MAANRFLAETERVGDLLVFEPDEIAHLRHFRLQGIFPGQGIQRLIHQQELLILDGRSDLSLAQFHPFHVAATFDLALLVPDALSAAEVERVLRASGGDMLESLALFDEFRGAGVPEGMRSLAWRLTFRHPERTLRDKEIDGRRSQLLKSLENQLGVKPRTA